MNRRIARSIRSWFSALLILPVGLTGCQDRAPDYSSPLAPAPPLRDPDSLVKFLPEGTSFKSSIISDRILGRSTKTVEEALGRLQVTARDGALYDGIGREIKFLELKKVKSKNKDFEKSLARLRSKFCVVVIAE